MIQSKKIFCTLGPSSLNREVITKLDNLGVDMFRINLSHTAIGDIERVIRLIRQYSKKPICLDTEGAQVRIGSVENNRIHLKENYTLRITGEKILGTPEKIILTPPIAVAQIRPGDLISIDFDSVLLRVTHRDRNSVSAEVICGGYIGSNKAVAIDREMKLPIISKKDKIAVKIGLKNNIRHFALSFANDRASVKYFRKFIHKRSYIISKIECRKGVENIDGILEASDAVLIDRGDLSREEPVEKIPFLQKLIVKKANQKKVPVYVATNLLESMVKSKNPTRAEINDIVNTLMDGADGLVLAAETAIGLHPVSCAAMVLRTIKQFSKFSRKSSLADLRENHSFLLVEPHGGALVNRVLENPDMEAIKKYRTLSVDKTFLMDAEQIAIGTFSPLEGFMTKKELSSVIEDYRLPNGISWPVPIVLQTQREKADNLKKENNIALTLEGTTTPYAILRLEDIYTYDFDKLCLKIFGTCNQRHPGVRLFAKRGKCFLGGEIHLIRRLPSEYKHFEITPKQARAIFESKGWSSIVGFHTRNVIHRIHEHIQMLALERYHCDGIFIHPAIGPKNTGDYTEEIILKSYELMVNKHYPSDKVVLGAFQSYSRYAGPREAVFTALCRKNFGCSHFIIGRDHTGFSNFYRPYDAHAIFEEHFKDIGITPIFFKELHYCASCNNYVEKCNHHKADALCNISGSKAREILKSKKFPPAWFMRKDISGLILESMKNEKKVFTP